ncbi:MAG: transcription antitermination factor NusB [unclassified Hahellaceae]|nr:transcription antitermination factor NusB [Hahellaceae bacterium]
MRSGDGFTIADDEGSQLVKAGKTSKLRQEARRLLLQALYQRILSNDPVSAIESQFMADNDLKSFDTVYFHDVFIGISQNAKAIDEAFEPLLDRRLQDVDPIELSVLRLACYELKFRLDVPYKVVINEAIDLAKSFGGTDGHKYVNGVVDKLAARLRGEEVRAQRS